MTKAFSRVRGFVQDAAGTPSLISTLYSTAPSCGDLMYLCQRCYPPNGPGAWTVEEHFNPELRDWKCQACPNGGDCRGPKLWVKCMENMVICALVWKISKIEKSLFGRVSNKKHVLVESLIYKWANYQERNIHFGLVHIEDHWTIGRKKAVATQQSVRPILGSIS